MEENKNLNFSEALTFVKDGYKIKRRGWNGKDIYVIFHELPDNYLIEGLLSYPVLVFINKGTNLCQIGWLATQSDLLSDDWIAFN